MANPASGPVRVLTIFGTRPEAIKLFPVIHALEADARIDSRVCVSGQHRDLVGPVLELAGIRPHHELAAMQAGQSLDRLTAALLPALGQVIEAEAPDWVIVQGDTATAMAGALAAYHRRVKVAHVEAGLRSGDIHQPWPEEVNRRIISAIARLHCAPTETAAAALRREAVDPATIHVTGNTVVDALHWTKERVAQDAALTAGLREIEQRFSGQRIIAVTSHRRESWGEGVSAIAEAIRQLAARPDVAAVVPLHPNPNVRSAMEKALSGAGNVALIEPLDYPHFVHLLAISHLVLTDSGGVQEEAPALGKPVLVLREVTERPEGVAAGTARLVGTNTERIVSEVTRLLDDPAAYAAMARAHSPYGDGRSAARIVDLLAG